MLSRHPFRALALWAGIALAPAAFGQGNTSGTLSGRVVSDDGAALPGVTVTVTSPALQVPRSAVASSSGTYILKFLPPGDYEAAFELTGFQAKKRHLRIALAQEVTLDVTLPLANVTETVVVEAGAGLVADFDQRATVAASYKADLVNKLPLSRSLDQAALLAPGVQATGPATGSGASATAAITIAGALSYENTFLLNGVVINENIRGQSLPLFIEDAIQETTASTGSISAEFGRFTGGVVQAITKSGGNQWSGSLRTTFNNDSWRSTSPFGESKRDVTVPTWEATLGGPLWKNKLWFFGAGRMVDDSLSAETRITRITFDQEDRERRYEGKLTFSPTSNHTFKGSYTGIERERTNQFFSNPLDLATLTDRQDPQNLLSVNYTGVLSSRLFVEAQFSRRQLRFEGNGSQFTDLERGTLLFDRQRGNLRYNAPTFCAVCSDPERRDNRNLLVKASYFVPGGATGAHNLVFGFDSFDDQRYSNNHQSGSDFRVFGTTTLIQGSDVFPVFASDGTTIIRWTPIFERSRGASFKTHSAFVNDTWRPSDRLTLNVGLRYDKNDGVDSFGNDVVKDAAFSPRLSATWEAEEGRLTFAAGYARYVAAISNPIGDTGSPGGQPATIDFTYQGPAINTVPGASPVSTSEALRQLFGWFFANGGTSRPTRGAPSIPGLTAGIDERLASPAVDEWTLGLTRRLGSRGMVRLDGVWREYGNFYSYRVDTTTGTVVNDLGQRFDFARVENSDAVSRRYRGLNLQASYRFGDRLTLAGNYTLSRTDGNFDGESRTSGPGYAGADYYPEYVEERWDRPHGALSVDRTHRARVWATWDPPLPAALGKATLGVLQTYDSGLPYGAVGSIDPSPFVANPGYETPLEDTTYFFTARDAFRTDAVLRTDLSLNLARALPGAGSRAELFLRAVLTNVFDRGAIVDNNDNRIRRTVLTRNNSAAYAAFDPFREQPVQGVHWDLGPGFGEALSRDAYQYPRAFSFSVGVRF
jgi:outer membrane receptor for ferrienterochelin and colicin